ncbi:MAG: AIR synthase-related protein, partial [Pseudoxanthomonas sp.]
QALLAGAAVDRGLRARLERPTPRVEAGRALLGLAHACIDVSDGLLADLGHVCARSGVGARIEREALPLSAALARFDPELRWPWQLAGGDDYELCFTAPASAHDAIARAMDLIGQQATPIGRIVEGSGVAVLDAAGRPWQPPRAGYAHF